MKNCETLWQGSNSAEGPIGELSSSLGDQHCGLLKVSKEPLSRAHRLERSWVVRKIEAAWTRRGDEARGEARKR